MLDRPTVRGRPPAPVLAVLIILRTTSGLMLLLFLAAVLAPGMPEHDPGTQGAPVEYYPLLLGLGGLWTARAVGRGRRGGRVLAVVAGLLFLCSGAGLLDLPSPYDLLGLVPVLAGIAVIALLLAPRESRDWFRAERWTETR